MDSELPVFNQAEKKLIKLVYPNIVKSLDSPEEYYIRSISIDENAIFVHMNCLSHLLGPVLDGTITVICSIQGKVIEVLPQ